MHEPIHHYLPESLCTWVEQRYYAQINAQARFEVLIGDPRFWRFRWLLAWRPSASGCTLFNVHAGPVV